jgi:hypothetical protein
VVVAQDNQRQELMDIARINTVKTLLQIAILKPWAILGWFGLFSIHQETEANHNT